MELEQFKSRKVQNSEEIRYEVYTFSNKTILFYDGCIARKNQVYLSKSGGRKLLRDSIDAMMLANLLNTFYFACPESFLLVD